MKKIEIYYPFINDPHQLPLIPLFLVYFFPKFSIYVRHKFNSVW